jgi:hypothetical protein
MSMPTDGSLHVKAVLELQAAERELNIVANITYQLTPA